jgi:hypothetical protein
VVKTVERVEARPYSRPMLATAEGLSDSAAFQILFDYISGRNEPEREIAMTAPVLSADSIFVPEFVRRNQTAVEIEGT